VGQLFQPIRNRIILCPETYGSAGTPVLTGGIVGPGSGIQSETQGSPIYEDASLGLGVTTFDAMATPRSSMINWSEVLRSDALGLFALYSTLGHGSDAVGAAVSGIYPHVGAVNANLPGTFTAYHDTGLATEYLQYAYATLASTGISWSPSQAVSIATQLAAFPAVVLTSSRPTIATAVSGQGARVYDGVYTYQSGTVGTTYPVADAVSGSLNFTRGIAPVLTGASATPTDMSPANLVMNGSFELVYRGSGASTAHADWLQWKKQGGQAHPNTITWTLPDLTTISISWWEMMFSKCQIVPAGDNTLHVSVDFQAISNLALANVWDGTTGAWTGVVGAPAGVVVHNKLATAFA
jgi:hypothetical protein